MTLSEKDSLFPAKLQENISGPWSLSTKCRECTYIPCLPVLRVRSTTSTIPGDEVRRLLPTSDQYIGDKRYLLSQRYTEPSHYVQILYLRSRPVSINPYLTTSQHSGERGPSPCALIQSGLGESNHLVFYVNSIGGATLIQPCQLS